MSFSEDGEGNTARLERIEAKLDYLISALAEEGEEDGPTHALDGSPIGAPRDETEEL